MLVLPEDIRTVLAHTLQVWLEKNSVDLLDHEVIYLKKIIDYLASNPQPLHNYTQLQLEKDFIKFLNFSVVISNSLMISLFSCLNLNHRSVEFT